MSAGTDLRANILLVDDKPEQLFALQTVVADLNQNVMTARSGREALRHLLANEFAVIILDVNMPGMDGFETAALIRQRKQSEHTPIIFITAYDTTLTHVSQGYSLGAVDYIQRPIIPEILKAKVSALVELYRKNELIRRLREEEHERRLAENQERLEAEAKRNIFFVLSIDLLCISGYDGFFKQLNPAWEKSLGYPDPELKARPMLEFVHPADVEGTREQFERLMNGETIAHFESRFQAKDGSWRWLGWTAAPFAAEKLIYIYARDVTNQKLAEEDRARLLTLEKERARRFHRLAEASIAINGALATNRIQQVANQQALETIGAHVAMLRTWPDTERLSPTSTTVLSPRYEAWRGRNIEHSAAYDEVRKFQGPVRLTRQQTAELTGRGNGEEDPELDPPLSGWLAAPLTSREGRLMGTIELTDKTDGEFDEQDEAILIQLAQMASLAIENSLFSEAREANRLKDEFLATLSHELRTPLTSILNGTWLLRTLHGDRERMEQAIEMIDRNARTQIRLIEDMLDISRITTGKLRLEWQSLDLCRVAEQAADGLRGAAGERGIEINVKADPEIQPIDGDPDRLNQVVANLLSNAIKFTPPGGRIEIRLEREGPFVVLMVQDNGQGIEPAFLPWVFERFRQGDAASTRRHGGLGLGLSIVKHVVELHGGTVEALSEGQGRGATFVVRLPARRLENGEPGGRDPGGQGIARVPWSPDTLRDLRILVVDDQVDSRRMIQAVLEECGARVSSASSAAEALEMIRQCLEENRFHVLVSDIAMPHEDGYDFIRKIRSLAAEEGGSIPALALTAYARDIDRRQALVSGFQMHLAKPVEPGRLVQTVASLARRHAGGVRAGNGSKRPKPDPPAAAATMDPAGSEVD